MTLHPLRIFPILFIEIVLSLPMLYCGHRESPPASFHLQVELEPQSFLPSETPSCDNALELSLTLEGRPLLSRSYPLTTPSGEIVLESLVPARGYQLTAYFGFASSIPEGGRCGTVNIVRAYAETSFDLVPRESKELSLILKKCTDRVRDRPCRASFGGEVSPPEILLYPSRTGCNPYAFAISKPEDAGLRVGGRELSGRPSPAVYYRAGMNSPTNPFAFQTVINQIPSRSENATIQYHPGSLCFNPYDPQSNHFDLPPSLRLRWDPAIITGNLYIVVSQDPSIVKEKGTLSNQEIQKLNPLSVPVDDGASGYSPAITFPPPWYLGIYAQEDGVWYREGGLSYLPEWFSKREEVK